MRAVFQGYPFIISVDDDVTSPSVGYSTVKTATVHLLFEDAATTRDVLDGHLVAYTVRRLLMTGATATAAATAAATSAGNYYSSGCEVNISPQTPVDIIRKAIEITLELSGAASDNAGQKNAKRIGRGETTTATAAATTATTATESNLTGRSHADRLGLELFHAKSEWNVTSGMLESDVGRYKLLDTCM